MLPRLLAWTALILLTAYLVFIGGGWAGIYSVEIRTLSLILIAAVLGVWCIVMIRKRSWQPRSQLLPAFGVGLVAFGIGTALSRQPRFGLDYLAYSVLLVALYLFFVRLLADPWFRPRLMGLVVVLALIVGVWYIEASVAKWIEWWSLVGRFTTPPLRPEFAGLTFGNPSAVMTMSVLLTLPAIGWIGTSTRVRVVASLSLVALSLVVTLLSGSRAGWLGLAIGLVVSAVILAAFPDNRRRIGAFIHSPTARLGLIGVVIAGGIAAVALLPAILVRVGAGGDALRGTYFQAALRMFAEAPIQGTGPGTWVAQRVLYTRPDEPDFYIPYAHNIFLQTLSEFGLLGAAAGAIAALWVARLILAGARSRDTLTRRMAWVAIVSVAYFLGHQILDFYASSPAALFAAIIPIAYLDAMPKPTTITVSSTPARVQLPSRFAASLGTLLVVAAVGALAWSEANAATESRAVAAANDGDWSKALTDANAAANADPAWPSYQFTLGLAALRMGDATAALQPLTKAAETDGLPESWLALAAAQVETGDRGQAHGSLNQALRLGQQQVAVLIGAAGLYVRLGDVDRAADLYREAIVAVPSLAGDPTLAHREQLRNRWPMIVDAAIDDLGMSEAGAEAALEAGRNDDLQRITRSFDSSGQQLWARIQRAWAGDAASIVEIQQDSRSLPFDQQLFTWAARLSGKAGDRASAAEFRRLQLIVNGGITLNTWEVRIDPKPPPDAAAAGSTANGSSVAFYGHYTYRRPVPWNLLPPQVDQLTLE